MGFLQRACWEERKSETMDPRETSCFVSPICSNALPENWSPESMVFMADLGAGVVVVAGRVVLVGLFTLIGTLVEKELIGVVVLVVGRRRVGVVTGARDDVLGL